MSESFVSIEKSAYSGDVHSQIRLVIKYGCGDEVEENLFKAYAWLFVAKKSDCHIEPMFEQELWHRLKTDENRRKALIEGNELLSAVNNHKKKSWIKKVL